MYSQLFQFIFKDIHGSKLAIIILACIAGISNGAVLATLNEGVEQINLGVGQINPPLLTIFLVALITYLYTNYIALSAPDHEKPVLHLNILIPLLYASKTA